MTFKVHILLVEDNPVLGESLQEILKQYYFSVYLAPSLKQAKKILQTEPHISLAVVDICLDDKAADNQDGIKLLSWIRQEKNNLPVLIHSALLKPEIVIAALNDGADGWIKKEAPIEQLIRQIKRLTQYELLEELSRLKQSTNATFYLGESPQVKIMEDKINKAAEDSFISVFITGETGTGKSHIAKEIHRRGKRAAKPFVSISLADFQGAPDAINTELWGVTEGAFTNVKKTQGAFERANGGVLFLDEISEISLEVQRKLLRVLQERKVRKLGDDKEINLDIQLITATNKDMQSLIVQGRFAEDLYYRINTLPLVTTPLRENKRDICALALLCLNKMKNEQRTQITGLTQQAKAKLCKQSWKGNVRELFQVIERSVVLHTELKHQPLDSMHLEFPDNRVFSDDHSGLHVADESMRSKLIIIDKAARLSNGRRTKIVDFIEDISDRNWPTKIVKQAEADFQSILQDFPFLIDLYKR